LSQIHMAFSGHRNFAISYERQTKAKAFTHQFQV